MSVVVLACGAAGATFALRGGGQVAASTCRSSQIKTQPVLFPGTLGAEGGLGITNTSGSTCSLPMGAPRVSLVLRGQVLAVRQIHVAHPFRAGGEPVVHVLKSGESAQIDFEWRNWCGTPKLSNYPRDFPTLRMQFVGGPAISTRFGPKAYCSSPGSPSTITATQPLHLHTP